MLLSGPLFGCTAVGAGAGSTPLPDPSGPDLPSSSAGPSDPQSGAPPASAPTATSTATPAPDPSERCAALTAELDLRQQVGQLFMVAIASTGASATDRKILGDAAVGSVLLLGNTSAGVDAVREVTAAARRAARSPRGVEPLLAADQEGGQVQRLSGDGFSSIPSASDQAELSDAELTGAATRWGRQLDRAGIDADLAPVADLVPAELADVNRPIGRLDRGYGSDPQVVAAKVRAFVRGMDAAGVATAVKHFPGLGRVRGNTDFEVDVVDRTTRADDAGLAGFRAGVGAGVDMVMVASARYRRIDPERRAAFSPVVMGLIRDDLDFDGVVISDDLAAAAYTDVPARERALRFVRAGGDLAIVGDAGLLPAMAEAVIDEARDDADFAAAVAEKANRVVALKARRDLAGCQPSGRTGSAASPSRPGVGPQASTFRAARASRAGLTSSGRVSGIEA